MKKKLIIIGSLVAGVIILVVIAKANNKPKVEYTTTPVVRGDLVQTVSEVGTVRADKELDLNFNQLGKLNKILVKTGEVVKKDQVLMELDSGSLLIKEQEAQSSLEVARATLNKLIAGATASEVAVYESQANQARVAYLAAAEDQKKTQEAVAESISQAQKKVDDLESTAANNVTPQEQAVSTAELNLNNTKSSAQQLIDNNRNSLLTTIEAKIALTNTALDYVNRIVSDTDYNNSLSVKNYSYLSDTKNYYNQAIGLRAPALASLSTAKSDPASDNLAAAVTDALSYLNKALSVLNSCFSALEASVTSSSLSQTELDTFKTNINSHLSTVNTGVSAIQSADYSYNNSVLSYNNSVASAQDAVSQAQVNLSEAKRVAKNNLATAKTSGDQQLATAQSRVDTTREAWDVAQKQLIRIKTPARSEDITLARAQVSQAEANLNLIIKQKTDNQIISPIDGQVTKINYEIGEQVTSAKPALTMLTENNFEVEVDISEADISKVKIDNPAVITLDAFGENRKFAGTVYFIEPAATYIQDVIYYKVKVKFTDEAQILADLKSGMTANVIITTNKKDNVLIVPGRAVIDKNGAGKFVKILRDNKDAEEVQVGVGLNGNEGLVEVISHSLNEGDQVVTFTKTTE